MSKPLFTSGEIAKVCDCSESLVKDLLRTKRGKPPMITGAVMVTQGFRKRRFTWTDALVIRTYKSLRDAGLNRRRFVLGRPSLLDEVARFPECDRILKVELSEEAELTIDLYKVNHKLIDSMRKSGLNGR